MQIGASMNLVISVFITLTIFGPSILTEGLKFKHGRYEGGFLRPPTQRYEGELPPDMWFQQKLDHFNPQDMRTWQQRYFINDTFYKPGGPVFLQIGGEGTANPIWMVMGAWVNYGEQYNALLIQVEHRYYGKSHPVEDLTTGNMRFLSSEQALEDLANFITTMNTDPRITGAKWIAFGGSYPGSLATWMRAKYPHLVHAAVASSAPLVATADFSDYLRVVKESLDTTGPLCNINIQKATDAVSNLIQDMDGRKLLKSMFKLCDDIDPNNHDDISNLFSVLAGNFEGIVQYNKDNKGFEGGSGANITMDTLCGLMSRSTHQPIENYAAVNALMLNTSKEKCQDFKYSNMIKDLMGISWNTSASEGGRQWTYQTCTEFGYYQTSNYQNQPFGSRFPLKFWTQQCSDIFGPELNETVLNAAIKFTNANYGGLGVKVSRIIFPNGSIDPWHALGVTKDLSPDAKALYITGTAHCANMYPDSPDDLPALREARIVISKTIGSWLQQD